MKRHKPRTNAKWKCLGWMMVMVTLLFSVPVSAEKPKRGHHAHRAMMKMFYPPKAVMKHQAALDLTDQQKETIKQAMKKAKSKAVDAEFELEAALEELRELVNQDKIDRKEALAQADKVMKLEQRLKRIRLNMLIQTKNTLRPDQQGKLDALKAERKLRRKKRDRRHKRGPKEEVVYD